MQHVTYTFRLAIFEMKLFKRALTRTHTYTI